jgi:hypothetical protein
MRPALIAVWLACAAVTGWLAAQFYDAAHYQPELRRCASTLGKAADLLRDRRLCPKETSL